MSNAKFDKSLKTVTNSPCKLTAMEGEALTELMDQIVKNARSAINKVARRGGAVTLDICGQATAAFADITELAYERMIFGDDNPTKRGMNAFLKRQAHVKEEVSDEKRQTIARAIQHCCWRYGWTLYFQEANEGKVPCTVSIDQVSTKGGTRFQIRETGSSPRCLTKKKRLPELVIS